MAQDDRVLPEDGTSWMDHGGLHVHAPEHEHDTAFVVGTPTALRRLRDQIDVALQRSQPGHLVAFAADGEGYDLVIVALDEPDFREASFPYATPTWPGSPWSLVVARQTPEGVRYDLRSPDDARSRTR